MSRTLSRLLIEHQNDEEKAVLKVANEYDENGKEIFLNMYNALKVTSEDLSRVYTDDELKELALRRKCRVKMHKYNCVWEAKKRFEKKGRLTGRSEQFINKMLIKAVKRGMVTPYSQKEIDEANYITRCELKKENNSKLDLWVSQKIAAFKDIQIDSDSDESSSVAASSKNNNDESESIGLPTQIIDNSINRAIAEVPDLAWAADALQINSESMSISLPPTQETIGLGGGSEDYTLFNTQVGPTSTQSQLVEIEGVQ